MSMHFAQYSTRNWLHHYSHATSGSPSLVVPLHYCVVQFWQMHLESSPQQLWQLGYVSGLMKALQYAFGLA
jgi:hypothetical protein